ncbi:MAG: hypothetical protein ACTIJA_03305 [Bavariicoccus seileri]|uniref:Uncharacterized protein n=1 Tax=Bavariicoccus seileri TaxID=549685 RepID=A0A3D4S5T7_9ENTE|nr:hypothetical protein [Bavariicoccus seileri]HCS93301.1 hypothetical protein [Bavariicoccus seileri]
MLQEITIPKERFTKNAIQIVCKEPVEITVFDKNGIAESLVSEPSKPITVFETPIENITKVVVRTLPNLKYDFLPAIKAL